jgi:carboxymethylenebutenolidase
VPPVSEIQFPNDGATIDGHLALPDDAGRAHPGLVLVPDVRGLYDHYRDVAGRFAAAGFATLAVNLYSREGAPDLADMEAVMRRIATLPDRRVLSDLAAAREHLAARPDIRADAMGITGFCLGGQYALMAACSLTGFQACVSWYGMLRYHEINELKPESPLDMASRLSCPYLGLFGREDALIPRTDVEELARRLAETAQPVEIHSYAGAGHAFFNDSRPEMYRPEAAADAWPRTIAFLQRHLSGSTTAGR